MLEFFEIVILSGLLTSFQDFLEIQQFFKDFPDLFQFSKILQDLVSIGKKLISSQPSINSFENIYNSVQAPTFNFVR